MSTAAGMTGTYGATETALLKSVSSAAICLAKSSAYRASLTQARWEMEPVKITLLLGRDPLGGLCCVSQTATHPTPEQQQCMPP